MKKNYSVLIFSILSIILLAGCGNKEYDEAIKQGKEAIEEDKFEEAATYFEAALEKKSDDKAASTYLKQTENMINGLNLLNGGELDESEKALEFITQEENGYETLVEKANAILQEIVSLKGTYEEIGKSLSDVKLHVDEGEYTKALTILAQIQQKDLTHSYYKTVKEEMAMIEQDINVKNKLYEETKKAYQAAGKLKDEKNYNDALAIVKDTLSNDLADPSLQTLKTELESLQNELNEKLAAIENENKKRTMIEAVKGYWVHTEYSNQYCSFTDGAYVCPTDSSDIYFFGEITGWDANAEKGTVIMHMKDGSEFTTHISNGLLVLRDGNYKRISKAELSEEFGSEALERFFDINVYKSFDENYN